MQWRVLGNNTYGIVNHYLSLIAAGELGIALWRGDMKDLLKQMIVGTSLESLARKLHVAFTRERCAACTSTVEDKNRLYDIQTLEVMKRVLHKDSNCVDVGCHQGSILRKMLRFAPKGTYFAFEPLPEMYQGLLESFGNLANIHLYDYALSDTAGTTSFQHVVSNPGYSGFRQRRYDRPHEQIQQITVKTNLLDNLVPKHISIQFIKVDVEGAELEVFKGAIETIKRSRPIIVFEHGLGAADYYGTTPENMYDLLAVQCGLKLFLMAEWLESNGRVSLNREAFCEQFSSGTYYFMAATANYRNR